MSREVGGVGPRTVAAVGGVAVVATAILTGVTGPVSSSFWPRALFVACWLAAAVLVAWRGEPGVASVVTVVFLISFPIAFSGTSAGLPVVDQIWRAVGSASVVAFLYLFPRGQFEPRWTVVSFVGSAAYLIARAVFPGLASWPGDLVIFPLILILALCLQVVRFRSASNSIDRRRLQIVGLTCAAALVGQLILFGLLAAGWLGPAVAAELFVEPVSYVLALLMPAGVTLAMVPLGSRTRRLADHLAVSGEDATELIDRLNTLAQSVGLRPRPRPRRIRGDSPLAPPTGRLDRSGRFRQPGACSSLPSVAEATWPLTYRGTYRCSATRHAAPRGTAVGRRPPDPASAVDSVGAVGGIRPSPPTNSTRPAPGFSTSARRNAVGCVPICTTNWAQPWRG